MNWRRGELRTIELGQYKRRNGSTSQYITYSKYKIPAPYDRIVSQLVAEDKHALDHDSHESRCRQAYAKETLDALGDELKEYRRSKLPPARFRSKVLTPILQRQLKGVHDSYTPAVHAAIASTNGELSIQDTTAFYLRRDPVDPIFIRSYRRNLLYLPEPRWHLGLVMEVDSLSSATAKDHYNRVRANHDIVAHHLHHDELDENQIPLLNHAEIKCIIDEGLEDYFQEELQKVVSSSSLINLLPSDHLSLQPEKIASVKKDLEHAS